MEIVGPSEALQSVRTLAGVAARTDATVLISGETGTGKEVVARFIHASSPRASHAFVAVNCAGLAQGLIESELFGHVRGAFTGAIHGRRGRFEEAERGTLFLDEIGSLPLASQGTLLRALQERAFEPVGSSRTIGVDVRILAATNVLLDVAVRDGRFRDDLYYRLSVFPIHLPPLRERPEDVEPLARHFMLRAAGRFAKSLAGISSDALRCLTSYAWPGNVRELQNAIEYAVVVETGPYLRASSLPLSIGRGPAPSLPPAPDGLRERLRSYERRLLEDAVREARGNKAEAARRLGIDPKNFNYFLRKHGLAARERAAGQTVRKAADP